MCSTKSLLLLAVIFVSTSFAACTTSESVSTFHDARVERVNSIGDIVTILKRGQPNIPKGYGVAAGDPQDGGELIKGFLEALELIRLATKELSSSKNDAIFKKYFNLGDKQVVKGVFEKLLGHDGAGAPELANIRVKRFTSVLDKKLTAKLANVKDSEDLNTASLEKCDKEHPELLLRNDAWKFPVYRYATSHDDCGRWANEGVTEDMFSFGSLLLHEYVHWDWFLKSVHHGEINDQKNGYGWKNCRALDKTLGISNADSYAWYATELFWAVTCHRDGVGYETREIELSRQPAPVW